MTRSSTIAEEMALDQLEPELVRAGYRVIRQPSRSEVPEFFAGYRPDAIAIGSPRNIAIEIKSGRSRHSDSNVEQIKQILGDRADWELKVVYFKLDQRPVRQTSFPSVIDRISQLRQLAEADTQAAFVMAQSVLEAAVRLLEPASTARPLSTRHAVSFLASEDYVESDEISRLLYIADFRNEIVHGAISSTPATQDVVYLLDIFSRILSDVDPEVPRA